LVVYNANLRAITAGDTYPARYLPFSIVQYRTLFLDPVANVAAQGRGAGAFWMIHRPDGHLISFYPIVVPVLVSPLYVPAVAYVHLLGWNAARLDHVARVMEKLVASFLAALSAALLYLLLRRRASAAVALLLTLAYAFGTTTWVISSQALWQHGMAELLLIATLLFLTGRCTTPRAFAAGLLLGLIASNRPPDAVLGLVLGIYGLYWAGWRRVAALAAGSVVPVLLVMLYNLRATGNIAGGYGLLGTSNFFSHSLLPGIAGVLVSPTRGLLVFSPFLIFLALAWRHLPRERNERLLTLAMSLAVAVQLVVYAKADWRAGFSWGSRYMTDLLPFLIWILVPVVAALRGVAKACFVCLVGVAVVIEAIGAFSFNGGFDTPIFAADRGTELDMRPAWNWQNAGFITGLRSGRARGDLLGDVRGSFDGFDIGGHTTSAVRAGQHVAATGWTLVGRHSPLQVAVIVDGGAAFATQTFTERPDVRATLYASNPSGWRIPIDTAALTPGKHRLTAMLWVTGRSDGQYLDQRELNVLPATAGDAADAAIDDQDLDASFRTAAARLREHQQPAGSWLTAYTSETRFRDPHPEMNTFLTALLVDLLHPVAAKAGIGDVLQRARAHLTGQIEAGGLVRYHGLPNGPGIGTLGCAITPDTDNTALTWRLAPAADRARLTAALATIEHYRTREGLYRTWLAPREAYQCLDPGSDPNPADIAIQMHLLMLLSEVRPAAAQALCGAIRPLVDQDRIWVYYRKAPLVPILRLPDLHRDGCAVELPERRMQSDIAGQQIWVTVARMVAGAATGKATPDAVLVRAILRELAREDFAHIRLNPPLLYHNDLSATVSRYYWSEDAGYALWLRLHDKYQSLRSSPSAN
jgi:hypothetical protein